MAATSDVTIAQDGGGNAKLHPYVVALVRWCVSCIWSTATVMLHRLMTAPLQLPQITASKPPASSTRPPARPASSGHIHPEPLVTCEVLHQPTTPELDFIFVHGLYGSLENTWRQGDWRSKYKIGPNKVPLKRSNSIPTPCICDGCTCKDTLCLEDVNCVKMKTQRSCSNQEFKKNLDSMFSNIDERSYFKTKRKVLPNDDLFITEKFYNNTILNQVKIVDNFEMQAQFVRELFNKNICDEEMKLICDKSKENLKNESAGLDAGKFRSEIDDYICECNEKDCDVGCGCICDKCYSPCWPKDWLQVDFPNARIISVNYTSDPYLWRPLWVKECKRLRLHERAEQMTQQLLELGVGQRPIVWVGHSKGGLFIKQIYCEAYEAYLKTTKEQSSPHNKEQNLNDQYHKCNECENGNEKHDISLQHLSSIDTTDYIAFKTESKNEIIETDDVGDDVSSKYSPQLRSTLWSNSSGFMFYSVPHRGSPLADIKTPITARSIELLEISKDNSLVLSLHSRWLQATEPTAPLVRSLVETNRTLMSVLWLRIVSVESADAGIGALCGISVDHREICKPSSRSCILYKELLNLIQASVDKWRCNSNFECLKQGIQ